MLIIMAGLPASGKSTLAYALADRLAGVVLNKDEIRAALFASTDIENCATQDDFCMEIMLQTATYLFGKNPSRYIFLDGRTFSRRYQIDRAIEAAEAFAQPSRIIECVVSDEDARKRLAAQAKRNQHPAANRDFSLYLEVKTRFEEIVAPKSVIDTAQPLEICLKLALTAFD